MNVLTYKHIFRSSRKRCGISLTKNIEDNNNIIDDDFTKLYIKYNFYVYSTYIFNITFQFLVSLNNFKEYITSKNNVV
jgi:hypothetical protein